MIITADEYRNMGFECSDEPLLESCLLRAEYTLSGLCEGRHLAALAAGGMAAECVKQAAAFQTAKLVKQEQQISVGSTERVAVGDFSYSVGTENAAASDDDTVYDLSMQTVRLLRAAGCMYGGREVRV